MQGLIHPFEIWRVHKTQFWEEFFINIYILGCSCLHIAAQFGHTALVAYFIARGVSPDLQDRGGMTALMWAAWKIQALDPVRLLMTLGASGSMVDHTHGK